MNDLNPYQTPETEIVSEVRPRYRRRTVVAFLVAAFLVYAGLFFHQRQSRSVTFIRNERFVVMWMFYFSERQTINTIQWWAFRPLSVWTADDPQTIHAALTSDVGRENLRHGSYCYLNDLSDLRLVTGK